VNNNVNIKLLRFSGIFAVIFAVGAVIVGILEWIVFGISGTIEYIDAGKRWSSSGDRFAVISLYTEENAALTKEQVESWVYRTDAALLESSISLKENARSWAYTYAVEKTLTVTGPKAQTTAEVIAAGGDFFVFHPQEFVYGSAFLNDLSNPNGVVIDDDLAWKLFGATDIVGMEVTVNGISFTVSGVSCRESDSGIYNYTYGERPRMYMSYAGFVKLYGNDAHITMYEAALPNAVKGFARNIFNGAVSVNEETMSVQEASDRFSLLNRYNNMKILKYSWIRENKIEYPYWENEAKVADYRCAILMIFEVISASAAVISMLLSFILLRISGYTVTDTVKNCYQKIQKSRAGNRSNHRKKKKIRRKRGNP